FGPIARSQIDTGQTGRVGSAARSRGLSPGVGSGGIPQPLKWTREVPRALRRQAIQPPGSIRCIQRGVSPMKRSCSAVALAVALPSLAAASELRRVADPVDGQYIVVLKEDLVRFGDDAGSRRPDVSSLAVDMAASYGLDVQMAYTHVLPGFVARTNAKG